MPDDIHAEIKHIQADNLKWNVKKTLHEIYIDTLRLGIKTYKNEKTNEFH